MDEVGARDMISVTSTRPGQDFATPARVSSDAVATLRTAWVGMDRAGEVVALSQRASLLALLQDRVERANELAGVERTASGGDPGRGDPERLRKLYPPYPGAVQERAAYLDRLAGLGKLNRALSFGLESAGAGEQLAAEVAARLARLPGTGLSGRGDGAAAMGFVGTG